MSELINCTLLRHGFVSCCASPSWAKYCDWCTWFCFLICAALAYAFATISPTMEWGMVLTAGFVIVLLFFTGMLINIKVRTAMYHEKVLSGRG